jgi:D-alanine-D-alanine ligase
MRIGVLMGGYSSEREVSLKSGKAVYEALKVSGQDAVAVDIQKPDKDYVVDLLLSYDIDAAFVALHGEFGEDGKLQAVLEEMRIPYTGSGPKASALAMDKMSSRNEFSAAGLAVPVSCLLDRGHKKIKGLKGFPLVVKPATGGSSLGLSIADNPAQLKSAINLAFQYDKKVIIEEYVAGREITVGIFEDRPLEPIEIKPKQRFFDYKAKYAAGQTEYIVPARLPFKAMALLKQTALKAHTALGCSFFSRVDIILDADNKPVVLEVNTIPGFTATSLLPKAALERGIPFTELVARICRQAFTAPEQAGKTSAERVGV